jgi:3-isopropylmalate/(R)-2-methylmalate dehydratase large subunit
MQGEGRQDHAAGHRRDRVGKPASRTRCRRPRSRSSSLNCGVGARNMRYTSLCMASSRQGIELRHRIERGFSAFPRFTRPVSRPRCPGIMTRASKTLYDKIWDAHVVNEQDGEAILYIDLHLIHEVTTPQAFAGLRAAGRKVRRPDRTLAVADHNIPTEGQAKGVDAVADEEARLQLKTLARNVKDNGIEFFPMGDIRNGIVHVVGPEQGRTQPGMTIVCGDSHTSTHGAFGALAHGIGTSEVEHVLATQTLRQEKAKNMLVRVDGQLGPGVTAKDIILAVIGEIGTAGGTGYVIEFAGQAIRALSMEGRMTLCNLTIEGGAKAGLIAADEKTFAYIQGKPRPPRARPGTWRSYWKTLRQRRGRPFRPHRGARRLGPGARWSPGAPRPRMSSRCTGIVPDPESFATPDKRASAHRALDYMGLTPASRSPTSRIDRVFIGSCTNSRIEDMRAAAAVVQEAFLHGRLVSPARQGHGRAGLGPGEGTGRGRRPGRHLQGRRLRLARAGLLDVPGHEPRQAEAAQSAAPRPATATSRAARAAPAAPTWCRRPWRPRRRSPATWSTCGPGWRRPPDASLHPPRRPRGAAVAGQYRHRPDHPQAVPQDRRARGPGQGPVLRLPLRRRRKRDRRLRAEPARVQGLVRADRRRQFRLRKLARARPMGADGLRDHVRDLDQLRRHLQQQLLQQRPAAGGAEAGRSRP